MEFEIDVIILQFENGGSVILDKGVVLSQDRNV